MTYEVTIPQLEDLQRAFAKAPEIVKDEVTIAGNRALVRYQATARQKSPIDTGQLRNSIQVSPMHERGNAIEGAVGTGVKHAIYMEQGTGIYGPAKSPIRPKKGKVLAWKSGGSWHYARQVKGSKPHWFMKTALERNQDATERDFDRALDNVTRRMAKEAA